MDQADACEQATKDAKLRAEKAEEEVKGLSIYDGLLMMSRLHHFGCFFVTPIFESYIKNISCSVPSSNKRTDQSQSLFKSMFDFL